MKPSQPHSWQIFRWFRNHVDNVVERLCISVWSSECVSVCVWFLFITRGIGKYLFRIKFDLHCSRTFWQYLEFVVRSWSHIKTLTMCYVLRGIPSFTHHSQFSVTFCGASHLLLTIHNSATAECSRIDWYCISLRGRTKYPWHVNNKTELRHLLPYLNRTDIPFGVPDSQGQSRDRYQTSVVTTLTHFYAYPWWLTRKQIDGQSKNEGD